MEINQPREEGVKMFKKSRGMRRFMFALVCVAALLVATGVGAQPKAAHEITVSAAISLKNAFEDIATIFQERNPGAKVLFNFGASGDLARQIEGGAPVDIFASAAQKDMDDIDRKGLVASNSRRNFAGNAVVLIKPANSKTPINSIEDLKRKEVGKISIGNPKTVPAGRYAEEALRHYNLWDAVKDRLVFAENVRQVLDYVARGEVDAGLVYSTDAMARSKEVKVVMKLPEGSHQPVVYPIGVIKGTKEESLSRAFADLVVSPEGQQILNRYGFIAAKPRM